MFPLKRIKDTDWVKSVDGGWVRHFNGHSLRLSPVSFASKDKGSSYGFKKGFRGLIDAADATLIRGFVKDVPELKRRLENIAKTPVTSNTFRDWVKKKGLE